MDPADQDADTQQTSEIVIEAIAEQTDVDPLEFDVPLGDVVDPDALDSLFDPQFEDEHRRPGRVEFVYQEYHVAVVSDPAGVVVEVTPVEERADADSVFGRQKA